MKINKIKTTLASMVYLFMIGKMYEDYISPNWAYQGFVLDYSKEKLITSFIFLLFYVVIFHQKNKSMNIFFQMGTFLILVPSLILFSYANLSWEFFGVTVMAFCIKWGVVNALNFRYYGFNFLDQSALQRYSLIFSLAVIVAVLVFSGFENINFDINNVYEFRLSARESIPFLLTYLVAIAAKLAVPVLMVVSLINKDKIYLLISLLCFFALFSLTSAKFSLFAPVFIYLIDVSMRKKASEIFFALILILLTIGCYILFYLNDDGIPLLAAMISYRLTMIPSLINWNYVDYFGSSSYFYLWSESKFTFGLLDIPQKINMINLIGLNYWGGENITANTGWIGSGFGNGWYWGVALYSFILGTLLSYIKSVSRFQNERLIVGIYVVPLFSAFTSSDLPSVLLTQGLFVALIISLVLKKRFN